MNSDTFMDVIDVNLKGTFHAIKAVTRIMMKQRAGVIINIIVCVKFHSGFLYHSGFSAGLLYGW